MHTAFQFAQLKLSTFCLYWRSTYIIGLLLLLFWTFTSFNVLSYKMLFSYNCFSFSCCILLALSSSYLSPPDTCAFWNSAHILQWYSEIARLLYSDPDPAKHDVYLWLKDERFLVNVAPSTPDNLSETLKRQFRNPSLCCLYLGGLLVLLSHLLSVEIFLCDSALSVHSSASYKHRYGCPFLWRDSIENSLVSLQ